MIHEVTLPPSELAAVAVLIPAWQPNSELLDILEGLLCHDFGAVLVVDDGSSAESQSVLEQASKMQRVRILHHAVNLGKGRALKTGINHFLSELPSLRGLVTADADGQHRIADIVAVGEALCAEQCEAVLGVRSFAGAVPLRSRLGNVLSRQLLAQVIGTTLTDTQTGLRGFARCLLPDLLRLEGERYEYEIAVLAYVCRRKSKLLELPIETVYLRSNRSSHFRPFRDSIRIGRTLARLCREKSS